MTDLSMLGEDGVWLAQQLRTQGALMPTIAVSGHAAAFVERLAGALFTHVLRKPLDPWQLVEVVASVRS